MSELTGGVPMKWLLMVAMFAAMLPGGGGGKSQQPLAAKQPVVKKAAAARQPVKAIPIPASFFGMIANRQSSYPLQIPYGNWRGWDFGGGWPDIELCKAASGDPSDTCFKWTPIDNALAGTFQAGVKDGALYTLSRSPLWSVDLNSDPTGQKGKGCNFYQPQFHSLAFAAGQCLIPMDLNSDGSGTDKMFKDWVTAIVTHVNSSAYLQTHTHITWWEPWNESHRSTTLPITPYAGTLSFEGTFAQLVRMTEDMRCVILGKGVIHNYPTAGKVTTCTNTALDSTAKISAPSFSFAKDFVLQNFLYCSNPPQGSQCTTGSAGSDAVDGINIHMYATSTTPETRAQVSIPSVRATLTPTDLAKPLVNGEFSWGTVSKGIIWTDVYSQAGFIPRIFALYWSDQISGNYWYAYDEAETGTGGLSNGKKLLHPQADGWIQTYNWMVDSVAQNDPFCTETGTVWTCDMVNAKGVATELVWDSSYAQNCSKMSVPIICGNGTYKVPARFTKDWIDLLGTVHSPLDKTVTIGANPILLEAGAGTFPSVPEDINLTVGVK